jgi:hypothetical protein
VSNCILQTALDAHFGGKTGSCLVPRLRSRLRQCLALLGCQHLVCNLITVVLRSGTFSPRVTNCTFQTLSGISVGSVSNVKLTRVVVSLLRLANMADHGPRRAGRFKFGTALQVQPTQVQTSNVKRPNVQTLKRPNFKLSQFQTLKRSHAQHLELQMFKVSRAQPSICQTF